jgi:phospholipid/cholesterol/gamma-HCH transport system substrate-binding protein
VLAVATLVAAVAVVAAVLLGGDGADYRVKAHFANASQLVEGNLVQVAGTAVGTVERIDLDDRGRAEVTLAITDSDYVPLRSGTEAVVRLASLSGVANRYVDLRLAGADRPDLPDGGQIAQADTKSAVDLDAVLNAFDQRARQDLQGVIRGFGR